MNMGIDQPINIENKTPIDDYMDDAILKDDMEDTIDLTLLINDEEIHGLRNDNE